MSVPANISAEIASLQAQVTAATPLVNAPFPTIKAMQLNSVNLLRDIQNLLVVPSLLDTWVAPVDPASIAAGFNAEVKAAEQLRDLSLMRGVVGRVVSNLDQLV